MFCFVFLSGSREHPTDEGFGMVTCASLLRFPGMLRHKGPTSLGEHFTPFSGQKQRKAQSENRPGLQTPDSKASPGETPHHSSSGAPCSSSNFLCHLCPQQMDASHSHSASASFPARIDRHLHTFERASNAFLMSHPHPHTLLSLPLKGNTKPRVIMGNHPNTS